MSGQPPSIGPTQLNRLRRNAAGSERSVEPDVSDVPVERLPRDGRRDRRVRRDHDCVDLLGDGGKGRIAGLPADLGGAWIDREDIMPSVCESAKYGVRGSVA
jgi:hypothetical protein